jgi:hypothetical protein
MAKTLTVWLLVVISAVVLAGVDAAIAAEVNNATSSDTLLKILGVVGLKVLPLVGSVAGGITLVWRFYDVWRAYLHIEMTIDSIEGGKVKLRTEVHNTNTLPRKLDAAFLIVGPAAECPDRPATLLLKRSFSDLSEMVGEVSKYVRNNPYHPLGDNLGHAIIPLPYYYIEQVDVADERLSFERIIDCARFPPNQYDARFYIEGARQLHRVVHAAFNVSPSTTVERSFVSGFGPQQKVTVRQLRGRATWLLRRELF